MTDKLNEIFELPQTNPEKAIKPKKSKKELEEDNDDFLKNIQALINSKKPKEESDKRKYERKKPSKEKSIDSEYKEKLRRNLEIARSKRKLKPKHLLEKGVSPKEEEEIKEPVKEPIEKPVEKVIEKVVDKVIEKPIEKPVEKVIDKVVHKVIEKPVEKQVEKVVHKVIEKPVEKVIEPIDERYSTYNKPPWFKKPSWMK